MYLYLRIHAHSTDLGLGFFPDGSQNLGRAGQGNALLYIVKPYFQLSPDPSLYPVSYLRYTQNKMPGPVCCLTQNNIVRGRTESARFEPRVS